MKNKILIIDDEPVITFSVQHFLKENGFIAEIAIPTDDICTIFNSFKPDLVLTDYFMPHMDGATIIKKIKGKKISFPIIVMTGFEKSFDLKKYENIRVISKPFSLQSLLVEIKSLLN